MCLFFVLFFLFFLRLRFMEEYFILRIAHSNMYTTNTIVN